MKAAYKRVQFLLENSILQNHKAAFDALGGFHGGTEDHYRIWHKDFMKLAFKESWLLSVFICCSSFCFAYFFSKNWIGSWLVYTVILIMWPVARIFLWSLFAIDEEKMCRHIFASYWADKKAWWMPSMQEVCLLPIGYLGVLFLLGIASGGE